MFNKVSFPNNRPQLNLGESENPKNTLEYKTILFTVVLYAGICFGLLGIHYLAPYLPKAPALLEEEEEVSGNSNISEGGRDLSKSSSGSPHNPFLFTDKVKKKTGNEGNVDDNTEKNQEVNTEENQEENNGE